ncbi:hypothetical protein B0H14DRAFT_3501651 [Mycena olivaceomarginata]|nr:hypothetical protein B0H14DRAFT_3501651 [Mycena olivaceomarginata]
MSAADSNDLAPLTDDDRASGTTGTPRPDSPTLVPRYDFSYHEFAEKEKAPAFRPHAFWNALSSASGRPLAKLAAVCRNPKHKIDDKEADRIVNNALPSFRFAATTLSAKGRLPPDITIVLAGIQYLVTDNPAVAKEWEFFPFPPSEIIPAYALDKSPPRTIVLKDIPSKDQINNAPHLSKIIRPARSPSAVADSPPPAKTSNPKPATAKKRKSKPQPPKSLATIDHESSEDEEPPTKRPKTTDNEKEVGPATSSVSGRLRSSNKSETAAPKPKKVLGSIDEQIDAMVPEIRAKLREMMIEKKKTGFRFIRSNDTRYTLTLSAFQGHRTYIPTNTLGPAPPPKDKDEPPKEPLVELVRFSTIECEQVLQPPGACFLCLMYGITCNPTAFGLACTHCNQKKFHPICDHTWDSSRMREFVGGIEELRGAMFPDVPAISNLIPHLIEQVSISRELYNSLRNDLTGALRDFFSKVRDYIALCGEEAFQQEFKSTLPNATARGQVNSIIHAFNHYNDPKTAHLPLKPYELSDDEKDDAGPSKSPRKVTLKVKESAEEGKEDDGMDEDAEGEEDTTVERKPESSKSSPRKKRKRTPSE